MAAEHEVKKQIKDLAATLEMSADDLLIVEQSAGTKIIRYEDLIADLQDRVQTDIKRAATYQGRDLTNVYTPAQLSAKIKKQDFKGINIGDYFDITLTNGEDVRIEVSAFNANLMQGDSVVNTNPHITMTFRDCLKTTYQMNPTNDNTGGYAASALANTVNTTIFNMLPAAWKAIVMPTRRLEPNKGTWAWATRNMWLLTEKEVFGCNHWGEPNYSGGVQQLPIFAHSFRHIVKGLGKGAAASGSRCTWWLATPYASDATAFCYVDYDGGAGSHGGASGSRGVAPGFNIY